MVAGGKDAVARIQGDPEFEEEATPIHLDLDLSEIDDSIRAEAVGRPTTVKLLTGKIVNITHAGDWSATAMRALSVGDWDSWAREVIEDDDEFEAWMKADLRNYQMEAVATRCSRIARQSLGKSRGRSGSSRTKRKR